MSHDEPTWAVIACDADGVTIEKAGTNPVELCDAVASWAQQEADKWPQMGLVYMLISPAEVAELERTS